MLARLVAYSDAVENGYTAIDDLTKVTRVIKRIIEFRRALYLECPVFELGVRRAERYSVNGLGLWQLVLELDSCVISPLCTDISLRC